MAQASFFSSLMQERIKEDYSDEFNEDAETTKGFINPALEYLAYVETLINKSLAG